MVGGSARRSPVLPLSLILVPCYTFFVRAFSSVGQSVRFTSVRSGVRAPQRPYFRTRHLAGFWLQLPDSMEDW